MMQILVWDQLTAIQNDLLKVVPKQVLITYEPRHEKTGFLLMRKQRRRSAVQ